MKISKQVAQVAADFHLLDMPFSKEPDWIFRTSEAWLATMKKIQFGDTKNAQLYERIKSLNLEDEYKQLKYVLVDLQHF